MADDRADSDMSGDTELRVHGVSGTSPEAILDYPVLERVAGDEKAGFYQKLFPPGGTERGSQPHRLEAYSWGNLTSGPAARAGWLMLLPFMLANLAHWMLPPIPADAGRRRAATARASAVLLRLFGLTLTLMLVLTAAQAAMDLIAWQCAGYFRCGPSSPLSAVLSDGWLSEPGRRLVASALVPLAMVAGVGLLGRRPLRRTSPEPDVSVATTAEHPMARARFWRGNPGMPALRSAHLAAATALLAAAVTWPATTLAASGPMWVIGVALCVAALAVLALAAVMVAAERTSGRGGHLTTAVIWARRAATILLLLGAVFAVWDHGAWQPASQLPGVNPAVLLTFGAGFVLLLLFTVAVAAGRPWTHGSGGDRATMRGFGAPATATLAFLVGGGFSAGIVYRTADLLGYPVLSDVSANRDREAVERIILDESLPFPTRQAAWDAESPLVLAPSYGWAGAAAAVIVAAAAVIIGVVALGVWRRIDPLARKIAAEHADGQPLEPVPEPWRGARTAVRARSGKAEEEVDVEPSADDDNAAGRDAVAAAAPPGLRNRLLDPAGPAVRRVALTVAIASLTEGVGRIIGQVVLVAGLVLLTGVGVYAAGLDNWQLVERPPLSTLAAAGTWLIGLFAIGLITLAWRMTKDPALRRTVGILWDVGSFWPRAAHPLAPPSYGERAVPDLVRRVTELTTNPQARVVLSGHSQGSVLAVATVMQLPDNVAAQASLITHGSPIRRLYARFFPAYVDAAALRSVANTVDGRWRNLYRDTDPIGSWVFAPDDGTGRPDGVPDQPVDCRLLDPSALGTPIAGHSDYWADTRYAAELDAFAAGHPTPDDHLQ